MEKRAIYNVKKDIDKLSLLDVIKNDEKINSFLKNNKVQKEIFVPNKILNLIVNNE